MGFITFLLIISLYFSNVKSFVTNKSKSTKYTKFSSNIGIDPISSEFSFAERLESLKIAADICIYTNHNIISETIEL